MLFIRNRENLCISIRCSWAFSVHPRYVHLADSHEWFHVLRCFVCVCVCAGVCFCNFELNLKYYTHAISGLNVTEMWRRKKYHLLRFKWKNQDLEMKLNCDIATIAAIHLSIFIRCDVDFSPESYIRFLVFSSNQIVMRQTTTLMSV